MRVTRVAARQAHYVPKTAGRPVGPFPPELYARPEIVIDYIPQEDEGFSHFPEGATVQNNWTPEQRFRCRLCEAVVLESEIAGHQCPDNYSAGEQDGY